VIAPPVSSENLSGGVEHFFGCAQFFFVGLTQYFHLPKWDVFWVRCSPEKSPLSTLIVCDDRFAIVASSKALIFRSGLLNFTCMSGQADPHLPFSLNPISRCWASIYALFTCPALARFLAQEVEL